MSFMLLKVVQQKLLLWVVPNIKIVTNSVRFGYAAANSEVASNVDKTW